MEKVLLKEKKSKKTKSTDRGEIKNSHPVIKLETTDLPVGK